jgi:glycine hydroxymethyltransferase
VTTASTFDDHLASVDPEVADAVGRELGRQRDTLELIASENFAPVAVLEAHGSVLTNKYAEGYPGRRYYGGCEFVDEVETLAIERAKALFGAEHANVQPHAGSQASAAVLSAFAEPGDAILGLDLAHGGHLTHGMHLNFSGKLYQAVAYHVDPATGLVDMDEVRALARSHRPKVLIAGWSAYPRQLDFAQFRTIADEVGAALWVDMAHFAGLVAAGLHPSPVPFADVVTTTTHKTLGGPRSALILSRAEHARRIDSNVFPGQQGGPLMHAIAAKAVTLKVAATEEFRERQVRTLIGARVLANRLLEGDSQAAGIRVVSGGTDVHLVLVDLRESQLTGRAAEDALHDVGITVNRNAVPGDPRPPMITSGLRIGTAALATRGFTSDDFVEVADLIAGVLVGNLDREEAQVRVKALTTAYPLYASV